MATVPGLAQLSNQTGGGGADNWIIKHKTASELRDSTTTLAADDTLWFPMEANKNYTFRAVIIMVSDPTPDFKWRTNGPASPTRVWIHKRHTLAGGTAFAGIGIETAYSPADNTLLVTAVAPSFIFLDGIVEAGATPGNFEFQWAQNTSNAAQTSIRRGSYLEYRETA